MPWSTPSLRDVRSIVRDNIRTSLPGADASIPNSVLRVLSDNQGALCHLTLQYLDWLALQLMPDTAEVEWLDRHGNIWLVNADGTTGRKIETNAIGTVNFTGISGSIVPLATPLIHGAISYETTEQIVCDVGPTPCRIRALDPGAIGNLAADETLGVDVTLPGIDDTVVVVEPGLLGGTDTESDDDLRFRVLDRIRQPPMGGAQNDYVQWALAVPGVTRAWCVPLEMGMGTITVRFMMDELRADNGGFPLQEDIAAVEAYLDIRRPVAVKDFFVTAPIPYPIYMEITYLDKDDAATRAAIVESVKSLMNERAQPGQTWWRSWSDEGITAASGVSAYTVNADDEVMPSPGHLAVLGSVTYE